VSTLTKVFVVLVTVLSVVLVALIVPFVANTQHYKSQVATAETQKSQADAAARLAMAELEAARAQESEQLILLKTKNQELTSRITTLGAELATARSAERELGNENARLQATNERLSAAASQYGSITESLQKELTDRREQMVAQQTRLIQLTDRNTDLEGQLDSLTRQVRRLREGMQQIQERSSELEGMLSRVPDEVKRTISASTDSGTAQPFMPESPIRGQVTRVEQLADETWVQVNVGKNDGVAPNMKFWVHRNGQFLGTLIITKVDQGDAAGRLQNLQGQVAQGDTVLTGTGF
jgi:myosin heavy subunit